MAKDSGHRNTVLLIGAAVIGLVALSNTGNKPTSPKPSPNATESKASSIDRNATSFLHMAGATYYSLSVDKLPNGHARILSRRNGPSGISYALREYDCPAGRFRYLGEGGTSEEAMAAGREGKYSELVDGSSSYHAGLEACHKIGVKLGG